MATFLSLFLAVLLLFYPHESLTEELFSSISTVMIVTGAIFLTLVPLLNVLLLRPLQKTALSLTSLSIELFRKDRLFQIVNLLIFSFSILSFVVSIDPDIVVFVSRTLLFAIWIVFLGFCIDGTWFIIRRGLQYLNPSSVAHHCYAYGSAGIREENDANVWKSLDGLTEIGVHALERQNLSLTIESLDYLEELIRHYLQSSKSISRAGIDHEKGAPDQVSYALFLLFQRLDLFREKALNTRNEAVLSHLVTTLAKIALSCGELDLSLVPLPLHFMGELGKKALEHDFVSLADRTTICLVEMARAIVEEVDLTYAELQPPFLTLISVMERIAHDMFRKDKSIQIELLVQPFRDLEQLFEHPKLKDHQDIPNLLNDVQRVIADFSTLQTVMHTMPTLPTEETGEQL